MLLLYKKIEYEWFDIFYLDFDKMFNNIICLVVIEKK